MAVKAIFGLHAFTGCDTMRENKASENLNKKSQTHITFSGIGITTDVTEEQLDVLQEFFCDIYGHKGTSTNDIRFKLYCSKQGQLEAKSIPPCLDSLKLHSRRATFQAFVWRQCLVPKSIIPSTLDDGWKMVEDEIVKSMNTVKLAPEEVLALIFCACPRKYGVKTCPCTGNGLFCSDACTKTGCENYLKE